MSVEPSWVILGAVILGGVVGLFQIPVWQGCAMAGIVIGRALMTWGQSLVVGWANRLYVMVRFALRGGLTSDDPGAVLAKVRELPSLIGTSQDKLYLVDKLHFAVALFGFLVIFSYLLARWRFRLRPTFFGPIMLFRISWQQRLMACGLGAINGYLIAHFLVRLLFPQPEAVIKVSSGQLANLLDKNLVLVLVGFILILIIFGLQASGGSQG